MAVTQNLDRHLAATQRFRAAWIELCRICADWNSETRDENVIVEEFWAAFEEFAPSTARAAQEDWMEQTQACWRGLPDLMGGWLTPLPA